MIKQESIDKLKDTIDIVTVISRCGLTLKKSGANMVAPCPFHSERSASFTVTSGKQIYKCFGCGVAGDAIEFVKEYKKLEFYDALEWLADEFKVQLEYDNDGVSPEVKDEMQRAYELMSKAKRIYNGLLLENEDALQYVTNVRGFTRQTIALWEIGYAPANWRTIADLAIKENCWDLAVKSGLCVEDKEKNRDFFYDRIIIPIHNEQGKVIAFGGRVWTSEQEANKKLSKYMNSPETFLYNKSEVLFGMNKASVAIAQMDEAVLLEGYMDVIMAHQHSITNSVAACGTSVTDTHRKKILKRTKNILLGGDNDDSGAKSINTSIDNFLRDGAQSVQVIQWPAGVKDIDQFLSEMPVEVEHG